MVDHVWELRLTADDLQDGYCLMPDNFGEVMVNVGAPFMKGIAGLTNKQEIGFGEVHVCNCRSKGIVIQSKTAVHIISAKIKAGFVNLLLPSSVQTYRDQFYHISSKFHFNSLTPPDTVIRALACLMQRRLGEHERSPDPIVLDAVALIAHQSGNLLVRDIYEGLGISKSTLEQRFQREVTISPKEFCKIEKLRGFMANYRQYHPSHNLTQLTFQSGYYDQSHFIKDFRYFMDMSPRTYFRKPHPATV